MVSNLTALTSAATPSTTRWRSAPTIGLLILALTASNLQPVHAADPENPAAAKPQDEVEEAASKLSPEHKTQLANFLQTLKEVKAKRCREQMKKEAEDVVKTAGVGPDAAKSLEAAANEAADRATGEWAVSVKKLFLKQVAEMPDEAWAGLSEAEAHADQLADAPSPDEIASIDPASSQIWKDALKRTLTPEQTAAWDKVLAQRLTDVRNLIKDSADKVRKQYRDGLNEQVAHLKEKLALPKDRADQVSELADRALEKTMEAWQKRAEEQVLGMAVGQQRVEVDRRNFTIPRRQEDDPERQPVWKDGLAKLLSAEEMKLWQASENELGAEANEFLKGMAEGIQDQVGKGIHDKVAVIGSTLSLPKEKTDQLNSLADSAVKKAVEAWRDQAAKYLLSLKGELRHEAIKQGNIYIPPNPKDRPDQQAVWKEGLAKALSADELKRWEASQAEATQRRLRAMGRVLVMELDQKVALTSTQREQLQPLAERLLKDDPALFGPGGFDNYGNMSATQVFTNAAGKAKEEDLKPLMDDIQRKRWRDACDPKNAESDPDEMPAAAQPDKTAKANQKPATRAAEPEDLEAVISKCFDERAAKERQKLLETMCLKAEDAARVAGLSDEAAGQLQIAAHGAVEEALGPWKEEIQYVRGQMRGDLAPEDIEQRFASMQQYQWYQRGMPSADNQSIWQAAVKTILTSPQADAWKKAVEDRKGFRIAAIAAVTVAEFDHNLSLTADQCGKLQPLVAAIVKDYDQDIAGFFGGFGTRRSWYLLPYTQFIPIVGVPEKDLKAILSAAQWTTWSESNQYGNSMSYWENLQQNHKMRMQQN